MKEKIAVIILAGSISTQVFADRDYQFKTERNVSVENMWDEDKNVRPEDDISSNNPWGSTRLGIIDMQSVGKPGSIQKRKYEERKQWR